MNEILWDLFFVKFLENRDLQTTLLMSDGLARFEHSESKSFVLGM